MSKLAKVMVYLIQEWFFVGRQFQRLQQQQQLHWSSSLSATMGLSSIDRFYNLAIFHTPLILNLLIVNTLLAGLMVLLTELLLQWQILPKQFTSIQATYNILKSIRNKIKTVTSTRNQLDSWLTIEQCLVYREAPIRMIRVCWLLT